MHLCVGVCIHVYSCVFVLTLCTLSPCLFSLQPDGSPANETECKEEQNPPRPCWGSLIFFDGDVPRFFPSSAPVGGWVDTLQGGPDQEVEFELDSFDFDYEEVIYNVIVRSVTHTSLL